MQVIRELDALPKGFGPAVVAMGNYDGVHVGHARILADVARAAADDGAVSCVLTFFPHPLQVLAPERAPAMIQTLEDRLDAIAALGCAAAVVLPFTRELASMEAEDFVRDLLVGRLRCAHLFVGEDARFGRKRGGDLSLLQRFAGEGAFRLTVTKTVEVDGERVSSSGIRRLVLAGDVAQAARWLGRPYVVSGRVVRGDGRGRGLGFPTANILPEATTRLGEGIYAVIAQTRLDRGPAAVHVGPIPTFGVERPVIEAHLLDFDGDLSGEHLRLHFLERLRDIRAFPDAASLQRAIADDIVRTREICRSSD